MLDRTALQRAATVFVLALLAMAPLAAGGQQVARHSKEDLSTPPVASAGEADPAGDSRIEDVTSAAAAVPSPNAPDLPAPQNLPDQESRGLGRPRGILGGPAVVDGDPESGPSRWLGAPFTELVRVAVGLGIVLALLVGTRAVLRRVIDPLGSGGRPSGVISVLARYPVARGQQLLLLRVAGRVVLLHQSRQAMTPLSEFADPDEVASLQARIEAGSRAASVGRFQALLDRLGGQDTSRLTAPQPGGTGGTQANEIIDLTRRRRSIWPLGIRKGAT